MENEVNFPQKKNTPVNAGFGRFHRRIAEKAAFFVRFYSGSHLRFLRRAFENVVFLPVYNLIYNQPLFRTGFAEVDAGGFDIFMPHEVSKKRDVVAAVEEAFRKAVPEGMGINYQRVYAIAQPQPFQLAGNAAGGNALPVLIEENKAAVLLLVPKPGKRFVLQAFGDIDAAQFSAFGIQVDMARADMLYLKLYQFADSRAGGSKEPDDKIPEHFPIFFQAGLEIVVILFADDIFQIGFLLDAHKRDFPCRLTNALQITIDCAQAEIDSPRLIVFNQPDFVVLKVFLCDLLKLPIELRQREKIGTGSVGRKIPFAQIDFKCFHHNERPPFTMIIQCGSAKNIENPAISDNYSCGRREGAGEYAESPKIRGFYKKNF